ncbi:MAG TPA: hypothetical protein VKX49_21745 [Bryobacteraceae bacterium]|nr:hypothetical protein [Bryobacteraceae bacterium]
MSESVPKYCAEQFDGVEANPAPTCIWTNGALFSQGMPAKTITQEAEVMLALAPTALEGTKQALNSVFPQTARSELKLPEI